MNDVRRKILKDVIDLLSLAASKIEDVSADEQAAYDNIPDSLHETERSEKMYDCISCLDEIYDQLDDITSSIEDLI